MAPEIQLAQKTIRRHYEIPNATRAPAPSVAPAPTVRTQKPPSPSFSPGSSSGSRGVVRNAPSFNSGGGGGGVTLQLGTFGLSLGGGGGGGCEACRESCYSRLHGTKSFSPCMKGCWNKYCRR